MSPPKPSAINRVNSVENVDRSTPPEPARATVILPYKVATLLYAFSERDEVLLLHRAQEPNRGLWSPCGGKLKTDHGESPYACAGREAFEEIGLRLRPADLHLTGLVSEHGYAGQTHWLMFLFEIRPRLKAVPPPHREGTFAFYPRAALDTLAMPDTDRDQIWPLFWRHRGGFFAAHCHCHPDGRSDWSVEESVPARPDHTDGSPRNNLS